MGSLDMWVGEWRAVCPGVTRGGSSFGGHLSGAGGPGVVSSRLLFEEGKGCGSLIHLGWRVTSLNSGSGVLVRTMLVVIIAARCDHALCTRRCASRDSDGRSAGSVGRRSGIGMV